MILDGVKAVVFDFDGTLYDKKRFPLWLILAGVSDLFRVQAERKTRKSLKGMDFGSEKAFNDAFFSKLSGSSDPAVMAKTEKWYNEVYMSRFIHVLRGHYSPYPRVEEVFGRLRTMGVQTGVYSDYPCVRERMEAIGLKDALGAQCWGAPELGAFKPAERPMREIVNELGVAPNEVLVVGDRPDTDGASASAVGAKFVCITKKAEECNGVDKMTWADFATIILG